MRLPHLPLLALVLFAGFSVSAEPAKKPNVVVIITDDQGYGDLGITGNAVVETPRLDALAGESVWLTDFQVSALCAPTRAALLTGRYPLRSGVTGVSGGAENMDSAEVTLAELFKAKGYRTAAFGKWHNGQAWPHHPNAQGFDTFIGFTSGHWGSYFNTTIQHNGDLYPTSGYLTDVLTDLSVDFIAQADERPFLLWFGVNTPHSPWQAPEALYDKYLAKGLDPYHATCYAMIENVDTNVGRILDQLKASGIADDTIVIFLSDNGPNGERYNAGWRDHKGRFHEGGTRVPFFLRWPSRFEGGLRNDALSAHIDLLPTLAELCNLDISAVKPLDGQSLVPALDGEIEAFPERRLYIHDAFGIPEAKAAIRTERYRAVRMLPEEWELYDIATDPSERVDLAALYACGVSHTALPASCTPECYGDGSADWLSQHELSKDSAAWLMQHGPVVAERIATLANAYAESFDDVTAHGMLSHPTELGHAEWLSVEFPAHESRLFGEVGQGIAFEGIHGWSHDWVSGWTDTKSGIVWPVRVVESGSYEVEVIYAATEDQLGAQLELSMGEHSHAFTINELCSPQILPNPDTFERKEADNVVWCEAAVGSIQLSASDGQLRLSAIEIPGASAPWIKGIRLKK